MTNIDKVLIKYLLETKDEELLIEVPSSLFKRQLQKNVFNSLLSYYQEFNKIPDIDSLKEYLKLTLPKKEAEFSISWLESGLENIENKYTKEELKAFIKKATQVNYIDNSIKALIEFAKEKNISKFSNLINELSQKLTLQNKAPVDIAKKVYSSENITMVEPFLPSMKQNGLFFTGVSIIGAGSGAGKSIFLMNQLMYNYEQGESVCLLNLELGFNETLARMYSCATGTPFYQVYTIPEEGIEEKVNKWREEFFNRKNKFYMEDTSLNINEVENIIRVYAKKGVKIFGIDYLNLVELSASKDEWRVMANFVKRLHRLTRELGIVIISPTQINIQDIKEKDNQISVTARGTRELEFSSSVFLVLWRNKEEYQNHTMRIFTIKARNSKSNVYITETNFKCMKFNDTGIVI